MLTVPLEEAHVLFQREAEEPERAVLGEEDECLVNHGDQLCELAGALLVQHQLEIEIAREVLAGGGEAVAVLVRHLLVAQLGQHRHALHHDLHRLLRVHQVQFVDDQDHVVHAPQALLHAQALLQQHLVVRVLRARRLQHAPRLQVVTTLHLQTAELEPHLDAVAVSDHQLHEHCTRLLDVTVLLLQNALLHALLDRLRAVRRRRRRLREQSLARGRVEALPDAAVHRLSPQSREVHRRRGERRKVRGGGGDGESGRGGRGGRGGGGRGFEEGGPRGVDAARGVEVAHALAVQRTPGTCCR